MPLPWFIRGRCKFNYRGSQKIITHTMGGKQRLGSGHTLQIEYIRDQNALKRIRNIWQSVDTKRVSLFATFYRSSIKARFLKESFLFRVMLYNA